MGLFSSREDDEEKAKKLRAEAGRLRIVGEFDEAFKRYKRAYSLYEKHGDIDAQLNVLCSLVETAPRNDRQQFLEKIIFVISTIQNPVEKTKALGNLDALKERLNIS